MRQTGFLATLLMSCLALSANAKVLPGDYVYWGLTTPLESLEAEAGGKDLDATFIYGIALAVGRAGEARVKEGFDLIRHTESMVIFLVGSALNSPVYEKSVGARPTFSAEPNLATPSTTPSTNASRNDNGNRRGRKVRQRALICLEGLTTGKPRKKEISACGGQAEYDELKEHMPQ